MVSSTSEYPHRVRQWRDYVAREAWKINASRIAEVGVFRGDTTRRFCQLDCVKEVYCIDPWSRTANDIQYKGVSHFKKFEGEMVTSTQEELDNMYFNVVTTSSKKARILRMPSSVAARQFDDGYFDFVFLDAIHFYDYVREDIDLWLPKIRAGGMFAGDDYGLVKFNEIDGGVKRAVDETFGDRVCFPMQLKDRVKEKVWCVQL